MIKSMQEEAKGIIKNVMSLVYFMRGAVSYTEMMQMSVSERQVISEFLEDRFKQEAKNPHPVY